MAMKRYTPEQIVAILRDVERRLFVNQCVTQNNSFPASIPEAQCARDVCDGKIVTQNRPWSGVGSGSSTTAPSPRPRHTVPGVGLKPATRGHASSVAGGLFSLV